MHNYVVNDLNNYIVNRESTKVAVELEEFIMKGLERDFIRCDYLTSQDSFEKYESEIEKSELLNEFRSLSLLLDADEIINLTALIENILIKDIDKL